MNTIKDRYKIIKSSFGDSKSKHTICYTDSLVSAETIVEAMKLYDESVKVRLAEDESKQELLSFLGFSQKGMPIKYDIKRTYNFKVLPYNDVFDISREKLKIQMENELSDMFSEMEEELKKRR